jgi:hypothetical protein
MDPSADSDADGLDSELPDGRPELSALADGRDSDDKLPLSLGEPVEPRALGEGHMLANYPIDLKRQSARGELIKPPCS